MDDPQLRKLRRVRKQILDCEKCALSRSCTQPVPVDVNPELDFGLVIVGEAPGREEDEAGIPFVGRSGKLLDDVLLDVGTDRQHTAVMNVVACRPPKNRDPKRAEIDACSGHFSRQLRSLQGTVGVLLGNAALRALRGPDVYITSERGNAFWALGMVWMPTFHPAYILRDMRKRTYLVDDIGMALRMSMGKTPLPDVAYDDAVALLGQELGAEVVSY